MSNNLAYRYLPDEIHKWPGLPLSLSGDEVMPLDYRAGDSGWLLYGRGLDKQRISDFQHRLGAAIVVVSSWRIDDYQVVRIAGSLSPRIKRLADECRLDVVPLGQIPRLRSPGLLVMDMDSTAIQIECIDEIARLAGVGDKVADITERAMQGELDFSESLRERVAQLAGADAVILQQVMETLPLMPGLTSLVRKLQSLDWHVAIASGGFTYFADNLRQQLRLFAAVANHLEVKEGKLTGKVRGPIVDAKYKATTLIRLAEELGVPLSQTVAIGDGANDLKMIRKAGLGIAYHAKPKVYAHAKVSIRHGDLMGVLCVLSGGLKHEER
ncbi:phosphoserine phosphatase [Xenorhabdus nematophila]|uniref:Phosphoserine phosphatase n=1 Tax=Xenorhabdus nematophila (strain ATCC 19061 / DSM 3370 / CCUG 14189 / LMG 1036 / NCIMB 9965 / AN6) TaxID=406817 RepID=D3VB13_XENNA|nr:phosphoserine phosphatase [Xenorhabdus nematophila]CEE90541.1 3-phosphoserine phosphatase [Xenorhabdus nematophila str. Anatoliense]CEF28717.1 3-phosphoserine phosphatase [Xenorhabdus nematophila str. Websteri]AYA42348.1 phosphoserine phosphatase [Xenorhabdus nematophila]KHD29189.1 phosphoserine phosphatase [Xenorhabdus nematophila]MBA0021080.1 phosphoserine phosphatase [Xenorhabdus nematophila]